MMSAVEVPKVVQITPPAESLVISHTQNHEYNCPEEFCTFTTSSPSLLGLHKAQVHKIKTGAKKGVAHQYFCPAAGCQFKPHSGRFFKVLDHLKTHYMKVHFEKKFKCSKCQRAFGLERDCLRHEKVCGQTYTCIECGKEYNNKTALNMHCLSKGHKPPPCVQKAPATVKNDTKISMKKSQLKDKKMVMATVPILPKFPLPSNMSILIPTHRIESTQSLCGALDAMKQVSLDAVEKTSGKEIPKQAENGINKFLVKADLSQQTSGCRNNSASISFNKDIVDSPIQPYVTIYSSEGLQGTAVSQKLPLSSTVSVIRVNSQNTKASKIDKSQGKRRPQKHASNHLILPVSTASPSGANQTLGIFPFQAQWWPAENASHLQDSGIERNIFVSSASSTLSPTSQSEPSSKKLKALSCNLVTPVSKFPATSSTHSALSAHQLSSTMATTESLDSGTAIQCNISNRRGISTRDYCHFTKPLEQKDASSHLPVPRGIISKSKESTEVQSSSVDLSNLPVANADTNSCLPYSSASKQEYISLSSAQTQTCVPHSTTSDLVNDTETQTLESFLLDSLNNLLSDCETQTLESPCPPYNLLNDIETQTLESPCPPYSLLNDIETQTFENPCPPISLLNDIETQTFESPPTISTIVNDSETQTNQSSPGFYGLVNNSETQTLGNAETLYQLLSECGTDRSKRNASVCNLFGESGTQTLLKTTSDSITQTLGTVMLDSTAQTSTVMHGARENIYSLENPISFPSADISCQVDTDDLFMNDALSTFDIMTQTLNDYNLNSSSSEPSVTTTQALSVRETGIQTINNSGSSDPQRMIFTVPPPESQNIMTQTTTDLLNPQTTALDVPESSVLLGRVQFIDKLDASTQNFANFDMPSSLFDSFDSWSNSVELPDSPAEAIKMFDSGKQRQGAVDNTDAVTQTLCQSDCTYQALNIMDTFTQTQEFSDTMTQTLLPSSSAESVHSKTQTSLQMFDSMTQTQTLDATMQSTEIFDPITPTMTGYDDTLTEIADKLLCDGSERQNLVMFNPLTQTVSSFDTMTQTSSNFEIMTQTDSSFDTMTQTPTSFEQTLQTDNNIESVSQTASSLDMMTQTAYSLDNMTQTAHVLDSVMQTANSFDIMTQTANSLETVAQTPSNHSAMTQTASAFDSFDLGCEMFTQTEEVKSVWEMTTQTDGFPLQGSDIMTQTVDDGLWEMMTQTENDLMSDMMTQTGPNDLWEEMTTQTDKVQGSDQMTQTADRYLWEMMTQTDEELVSDMMTQTGENSNLWGLCSQDGFDVTCDIFTQTGKNGLWETTTQTEAIMGSDMMTQTQDKGLWEMTTQTDEPMYKDLWEITTQTDEIMECDMMTQTMDNCLVETATQPDVDLASDMMTQTADNDFWEMAS